MTLEELEKAWREQGSGLISITDPSVLVQKVIIRHEKLSRILFWRNFREVIVAVPIIAVFEYYATLGAYAQHVSESEQQIWAWHFAAAGVLFVTMFLLVYHVRHRDKKPLFYGTVIEGIECSLRKLDNQIWLLKNVFWWYLLPPSLGITAVFFQVSWVMAQKDVGLTLDPVIVGFFVVGALIFYGIYCLNQAVVRMGLQPDRDELVAILDRLRSTA